MGVTKTEVYDEQHNSLATQLKALGHPARLAIVQFLINQKNVMISCIYFAVRKCIAASWINDRDQFLFPNNKWENYL